MASTSYASALARRLNTAPPAKASNLDNWDDEDDVSNNHDIVGSSSGSGSKAESGPAAQVNVWTERRATSGGDPWANGSGLQGPQVGRAVTVEEWNRANTSAPQILLARRIASPEAPVEQAGRSGAYPYGEMASNTGTTGTGTSSVQHAILHPTTPRILQRPANSSARGGSGSASPAPLSPEERAQALREREEKYRLARERIFGTGPSTPTADRSVAE
ncbi:hypothetical protein CF327_g2149 [Tilletia walkeri]|uniref:SUZ domain-containing protein n=1 Tax=Tilletia walkeri TaxID=117179 RepID=A0A8X7NEV8_9BASI|nr:hypothetical protein CF327_g2149 [Tilletia walkeri]KAE8271954.1 hypothetical protein A4X09_0g406 [Tilletia walkeri]